MTDASDSERVPLDVRTDLSLSVEGTDAALRSTGERLFLEFPSVVSAVEALRSLQSFDRQGLHRALMGADLALEIRARHRTLVVLGAGARAGPLSRRVGVAPAELRLCGALSGLWAGFTSTVERLR